MTLTIKEVSTKKDFTVRATNGRLFSYCDFFFELESRCSISADTNLVFRKDKFIKSSVIEWCNWYGSFSIEKVPIFDLSDPKIRISGDFIVHVYHFWFQYRFINRVNPYIVNHTEYPLEKLPLILEWILPYEIVRFQTNWSILSEKETEILEDNLRKLIDKEAYKEYFSKFLKS